ncbi:MAG: hypothetical protein IJ493_06955 [Clostridia bacterium]|nr:hypothetical protein [Clostridia bacterium]
MTFWLTLAGVLLLLAAIPRIRCFFKRMSLCIRLKQVCRRREFHLIGTHPLWMLGHKRGSACDFYVETSGSVWAVKLFGMARKNDALVFNQTGRYFVRHFAAFISYGSTVRIPIESKARSLPAYDFRRNYHMEWEIKTPRPVLLVHPTCREIHRQPQSGGETIIGAGDVVNGMEVFSLTRLISALEGEL